MISRRRLKCWGGCRHLRRGRHRGLLHDSSLFWKCGSALRPRGGTFFLRGPTAQEPCLNRQLGPPGAWLLPGRGRFHKRPRDRSLEELEPHGWLLHRCTLLCIVERERHPSNLESNLETERPGGSQQGKASREDPSETIH